MGAPAFKPAWWLRSPHLQTLWPSLVRGRFGVRPQLRRERVELDDGDFLDLDWHASSPASPTDRPIVLIVHGLEGSSRSPYAWGMLQATVAAGFDAVIMHFRGCSGEPNRAERTYHSGETTDLAHIVTILSQRASAVAAIGFSLGGNVLLKWLGETGRANPLACAVAISVPYRLERCGERLEHGFSRFYQWWLMRSLRGSVLRKWQSRECHHFELSEVPQTRTFREFDDAVTAPLHGFKDADDYYMRSSSRSYVPSIERPTLLLQAADDPFMYPDVIPHRDEIPPQVTLEVSATGGHVGFVAGTVPWRCEYWAESRATKFIKAHLDTG